MEDKCCEKEELTELQTAESNFPLILCEPLEISTENLAEDIEFDRDEFKRGLKDASYYSGVYTALINCGMPVEDATSYIFNDMNVKMNLKLSEITANTTVEVSKNKSIEIEKQTL